MPYYGGPDLGISYTFIAVQPFTAEHPIGSGIIVSYAPGDQFPGEDWGNAAHNLVEVGKAVRLATNIASVQPAETSHVTEESEAEEYPLDQGYGWYLLSDGTKVHGKDAANAAQAELDGS